MVAKLTDALKRIEGDFQDFCSEIENCRQSNAPADYRDGYGRFGRMFDLHEREETKRNLSQSEYKILDNAFKNDGFIKGVMILRNVSEHVEVADLTIHTNKNVPVTLINGSSAAAVFSAPIVPLCTTAGDVYRLNHLEMLTEAKTRIQRAITKAKG